MSQTMEKEQPGDAQPSSALSSKRRKCATSLKAEMLSDAEVSWREESMLSVLDPSNQDALLHSFVVWTETETRNWN